MKSPIPGGKGISFSKKGEIYTFVGKKAIARSPKDAYRILFRLVTRFPAEFVLFGDYFLPCMRTSDKIPDSIRVFGFLSQQRQKRRVECACF